MQPAPAPRFSATPSGGPGPAPAAGEHTREILAELGAEPARIDMLLAEGVVAEPGATSNGSG
jgi:alpha-methylacyl-CoA racemase